LLIAHPNAGTGTNEDLLHTADGGIRALSCADELEDIAQRLLRDAQNLRIAQAKGQAQAEAAVAQAHLVEERLKKDQALDDAAAAQRNRLTAEKKAIQLQALAELARRELYDERKRKDQALELSRQHAEIADRASLEAAEADATLKVELQLLQDKTEAADLARGVTLSPRFQPVLFLPSGHPRSHVYWIRAGGGLPQRCS
jgi:hypothetical protein